jgi:hypothetical protein
MPITPLRKVSRAIMPPISASLLSNGTLTS